MELHVLGFHTVEVGLHVADIGIINEMGAERQHPCINFGAGSSRMPLQPQPKMHM